jgi:hypothetical protein
VTEVPLPHDDRVSRIRFDSSLTLWTVRDFIITVDAPFTISDALGATRIDPAHVGRDGGLVTDRVLGHDIVETAISDDGVLTISLADDVDVQIAPLDVDWAWSIDAADGRSVSCGPMGKVFIEREQISTLPHTCELIAMAISEPRMPVDYIAKYREYCIDLDGGPVTQVIEYCPFCGAQLPASLRDEWFDRLDELGLEPDSPDIPDEMRDDRWWRDAGDR